MLPAAGTAAGDAVDASRQDRIRQGPLVAVLLDTGILYAYYDRSDAWHKRAVGLLRGEEGGLVVPSPVLPEVDQLFGVRIVAKARLVFYEGLAGSHYFVADLPRERYARVRELNQQFPDLELGFVDAAVVAISESLGLDSFRPSADRARSRSAARGSRQSPRRCA